MVADVHVVGSGGGDTHVGGRGNAGGERKSLDEFAVVAVALGGVKRVSGANMLSWRTTCLRTAGLGTEMEYDEEVAEPRLFRRPWNPQL